MLILASIFQSNIFSSPSLDLSSTQRHNQTPGELLPACTTRFSPINASGGYTVRLGIEEMGK